MQKMQEHFSALHCSTSCITHRDVGNADFAWSKISAHVVVRGDKLFPNEKLHF